MIQLYELRELNLRCFPIFSAIHYPIIAIKIDLTILSALLNSFPFIIQQEREQHLKVVLFANNDNNGNSDTTISICVLCSNLVRILCYIMNK